MRTRMTRLGTLLCGLLALALLFPGLALADIVPEPGPPPEPPAPQPVDALPDPTPAPQPATPTPPPPLETTAQPPLDNLDGEVVPYEAILLAGLFLVPLLLTIAIEMPVVLVAGRGSKAAWKAGVLVNTLTNPAAVLLVLALGPILSEGYAPAGWILVGAVEVAVVAVEWQVFRWVMPWSSRRAFAVSLIANALSFGIGLLLMQGLWQWTPLGV